MFSSILDNWDFNWNAVWKVKTGLEYFAWLANTRFLSVSCDIVVKMNRYGDYIAGDGYHGCRKKVTGKYRLSPARGCFITLGNCVVIKGLKKSCRLELMTLYARRIKYHEKRTGESVYQQR